MLADDVGMASMLAMELQSLANLSLTAFSPPRTAQHASIMQQLKGLQAMIQKHHWNEEIGIFANKFSAEYTGQCNASGIVKGTNCSGEECCKDGWYNRISPTSFYPMQSGIATDQQASTMMTRWLMNKDRFCITPVSAIEFCQTKKLVYRWCGRGEHTVAVLVL
jgi:hypothetical protein